MRFLLARGIAIALATAAACGGKPPPPTRGVVEADLGAWKFRRFQPLLDIEVWVQDNPAQAFAASYVSDAGEKRGRLQDSDIVNVFVTRYAKPDGIVRETVRLARRLAAEKGYLVDEAKIAGTRALTITGNNEAWVLWPAKLHVVKIGGVGRTDVPDGLVEDYADRYPSQLPGGALEGALPPGPGDQPAPEQPGYDPANPKPDLEQYDPDQVKLPPRRKP